MLKIISSNQFEGDLKIARKRGLELSLLKEVIATIAEETPLPDKCRVHSLKGEYSGFDECHVKPNWLLIYRIDRIKSELFLLRTGTHSDLFK